MFLTQEMSLTRLLEEGLPGWLRISLGSIMVASLGFLVSSEFQGSLALGPHITQMARLLEA